MTQTSTEMHPDCPICHDLAWTHHDASRTGAAVPHNYCGVCHTTFYEGPTGLVIRKGPTVI